MEYYEKVRQILKVNLSENEIREQINEDPKKKKRKRVKKNEKNDQLISFKPLGTYGFNETQNSKDIPIPEEEDFTKMCPVKYYPLQIEAIRWMYWIESGRRGEQQVGGILGDVMGLGKTIDALGMVAYDYYIKDRNNMYQKKPDASTLVITTLTLIGQWKSEAVKKFGIPENDVFIYHGPKRFHEYEQRISSGNVPSIVITNYETIQKDFETVNNSALFRTIWKRCFFDEAHLARNAKTNTYRALLALSALAKWCVTGTPIMNYTDDIRILSRLCTPSFPLNYGSSMQESKWKSLFFLRRSKEVLDLPKMIKEDVWLEFSKEERERYSELEGWAQDILDNLLKSKLLTKKIQKILNVICRLRQACDHIMLQEGYKVTSKILEEIKRKHGVEDIFKKKEEEEVSDGFDLFEFDDTFDMKKRKKKRKKPSLDIESYSEDEEESFEPQKNDKVEIRMEDKKVDETLLEKFSYSAKLIWIKNFVTKKFKEEDDSKIVILSQFATMLDLTEGMLIQEGFKCLRFDGRVQRPESREKIKELFSVDPSYKIMLVSLKAGGVGLNLVAARYLLNLDPWWNIPAEAQAENRVHRIGQKHEVYVYRLLITSSIEEEVLKIQEKKNNQENSFYDVDSERKWSINEIQCFINTIRVRQGKNKIIF